MPRSVRTGRDTRTPPCRVLVAVQLLIYGSTYQEDSVLFISGKKESHKSFCPGCSGLRCLVSKSCKTPVATKLEHSTWLEYPGTGAISPWRWYSHCDHCCITDPSSAGTPCSQLELHQGMLQEGMEPKWGWGRQGRGRCGNTEGATQSLLVFTKPRAPHMGTAGQAALYPTLNYDIKAGSSEG